MTCENQFYLMWAGAALGAFITAALILLWLEYRNLPDEWEGGE